MLKRVYFIAKDKALVHDYLLSINNEYFVKLTYIPLEDLSQHV